MAAYQALIQLLNEVPPEALQAETVLSAVQATLEECPEEDEMFLYLVAMEEGLLESRIPVRRIAKFLEKFGVVDASPGQLEQELLQLAENLSESEWRTPGVLQLEAQLNQLDSGGDVQVCLKYLEQRYQAVLAQIEGYQSTSLSPEEVTEETQVGHRYLTEGLRNWLTGLELLQEAAQQDSPWTQGLDIIAQGNRQLVAVQRLHQRVQAGVHRRY